MGNLDGFKVAILVTNGFEQAELLQPREALEKEGAKTSVVSPQGQTVRAWKANNWGETIKVDSPLSRTDASQFDALLLPGGVMNPDKLRMEPKAVDFVKSFIDSQKPVAAICHGPWILVETGAAEGRKITSWPSLKTDLRNAGADWVDQEAVVDGNLVSSRKPDDIPAFNKAMIGVFAKSRQKESTSAGAGSGHMQVTSIEQSAQHHVAKIKQLLKDVATHAKEDAAKISDARAQALFETTAEGLLGLAKAFDDYEQKKEQAWKTATS